MALTEKVLMKGNEALAEAAIRAGCRHFFGYPITPQTEVAAYMAKQMPKIGGTYLQAESEVAAINMVYGAASAGVRAMTSSSSPGISLKSEGISYMAGADLAGSSRPRPITGRRRARPVTATCMCSCSLRRPSRRWSTWYLTRSIWPTVTACPR